MSSEIWGVGMMSLCPTKGARCWIPDRVRPRGIGRFRSSEECFEMKNFEVVLLRFFVAYAPRNDRTDS